MKNYYYNDDGKVEFISNGEIETMLPFKQFKDVEVEPGYYLVVKNDVLEQVPNLEESQKIDLRRQIEEAKTFDELKSLLIKLLK